LTFEDIENFNYEQATQGKNEKNIIQNAFKQNNILDLDEFSSGDEII
jgi:hypothetical protein